MKKYFFLLLFLSLCFQELLLAQDSTSIQLSPFVIKLSQKDGETLFDGSFHFRQSLKEQRLMFKQDSNYIPEVVYNQNDILLLFAAPNDFQEFSFKLEGKDKHWSDWGIETAKQYFNLADGAYRFQLKARNAQGAVSATSYFQFYVNPPWYRTFWAMISYVFILVLGLRIGLHLFFKRR